MNSDLNIMPNIKLSVKQTFGIDSDLEVEAFEKINEKSKALYQIVGRNFLIILVISLISVMGQLTMPPRSSLFLLWILLILFVGVVVITV